MKRFASFIFLCSFIVISGYAQKWVDTYDKVGAPGYEELSQASYYASIGDNEKAIAYYNNSSLKFQYTA